MQRDNIGINLVKKSEVKYFALLTIFIISSVSLISLVFLLIMIPFPSVKPLNDYLIKCVPLPRFFFRETVLFPA